MLAAIPSSNSVGVDEMKNGYLEIFLPLPKLHCCDRMQWSLPFGNVLLLSRYDLFSIPLLPNSEGTLEMFYMPVAECRWQCPWNPHEGNCTFGCNICRGRPYCLYAKYANGIWAECVMITVFMRGFNVWCLHKNEATKNQITRQLMMTSSRSRGGPFPR